MTVAQRNMLFRLWGRARRVLRARGMTAKEADAHRHEITVEILDYDRSWKELNNTEVDKIKGGLLAIVEPANLNAQLDAQEGARKRLLYGLKNLDLQASYIAAVSRDKFGTEDWENLDLTSLKQLRMTVGARLRSKTNTTTPK